MRKGTCLLLIALGGAIGTVAAQAKIDETCIEAWERAWSARAIGTQCRWIDPAGRDKLAALEKAKLACAVGAATDAEKADLQTLVDETVRHMTESLKGAPCDGKARQFFDSQIAQASPPP